MQSFQLTLLFAAALLASLGLRLWLATRQMRHVAAHRDSVPAVFAASIPLEAHRKAADYTVAKGRLGLLSMAFGAAVLLGWTLLGGLDALNGALRDALFPRFGGMAYQLALLVAFSLIGTLLDLPFELYGIFRLEERFGFNRMTWQLYLADMLRNALVGLVLGLPIAALILWLMGTAGAWWWAWAWGAWVVFGLVVQVIFPVFIMPLYNKFEPLADETLKARAQALMARCGFTARGFFVMDGSKRSAHANAYFTGLGKSKRVVFFDTLISKLSPGEMEAVLAHELGHFKRRHILKGTLKMFAFSLAAFILLGWLSGQAWFYLGLGVQPSLDAPNDALALLLLMLVVPVFGVFASPLMARSSRKHEFEADAYACEHASGQDLAAALLKLHEDNASTLTPDPVYARFYYSHPPAAERLAALHPQTS
jgi:STE24 endopeptidase